MKATPLKDSYDGTPVKDYDGMNWMIFQYTDVDRDPWKWPKFMECDGRFYRWMSFDSDKNTINYKECKLSDISKPVKKA
jgi:hypothetical protein